MYTVHVNIMKNIMFHKYVVKQIMQFEETASIVQFRKCLSDIIFVLSPQRLCLFSPSSWIKSTIQLIMWGTECHDMNPFSCSTLNFLFCYADYFRTEISLVKKGVFFWKSRIIILMMRFFFINWLSTKDIAQFVIRCASSYINT